MYVFRCKFGDQIFLRRVECNIRSYYLIVMYIYVLYNFFLKKSILLCNILLVFYDASILNCKILFYY